ncbi:NADP-dependent oxidoreductase [Nocardia sp. 2]|uniref:NADP-dependent oxidoreductase n=1 Tax=Nocardia acididurans TaxID=2802282 RepID=A0ABS1MBA4_9NOCA|nr:NADP-dependent oxidoreductase [Nocardia acididurans]MBL1077034.1 NADP-dependent oxidoreductase [Nocardia acididurans]
MTRNREIRLVSYPVGAPRPSDFELVTTEPPTPGAGQILVRNTWMSVDPYMRERMYQPESYMPIYPLRATLDGAAVGEVVATRSDSIPVGATVAHFLGWREYAVLDAADATVLDLSVASAESFLGPLGTTGLTAHIAVTEIAPVRPGDVVFVSTAAGATGSIAGQLARRAGAATVIGATGGAHKAEKLRTTFGFDAAIDYQAGPVAEQLAALAPDGIDVYLDHVGGDHLVAALDALRPGGRIAQVGAISAYNATERIPGPHNLFLLAAKDATLRGLLITSYLDRFPQWIGQAGAWLADGSLRAETTVAVGIERAPHAFIDLMNGVNIGKMLVRL